jgi:hypothetical protein
MNPYCQIQVSSPGTLFFGARPRRRALEFGLDGGE